MSLSPLISICIPAYNRADKLKRLLDSIVSQQYKNFEVIISDDSSTNVVESLAKEYVESLPIIYNRNIPALGTPENWNEAVRRSKGQWIKIMHDDDYFATDTALGEFAQAANASPGAFIFSAYNNENAKGEKVAVYPSSSRLKKNINNPVNLWAQNIIGPPSVVLYPNDGNFIYDKRMKWLVDIDMYIRRMAASRVIYLPSTLVNVELGETQVTATVKSDPAVEIPEHFMLLEKVTLASLKNILVYDYHWRFIRNFKVNSFNFFYQYGYNGKIIPLYLSMIKWQNKIPFSLLRLGVFSKMFMFLHFLLHKKMLK